MGTATNANGYLLPTVGCIQFFFIYYSSLLGIMIQLRAGPQRANPGGSLYEDSGDDEFDKYIDNSIHFNFTD